MSAVKSGDLRTMGFACGGKFFLIAGRAPAARFSNAHVTTQFQIGKGSDGLEGPRRLVYDAARRGADAGLHAGGHAGDGERADRRDAQGDGRTGAFGEHVSPAAAAGSGGVQEVWRDPPLHELGRPGADGLGRVSDFLAAGRARDERGRRAVQELRRWHALYALAGNERGDAAGDRERHQHGARPVHPLDGALRAGRGGDAPDAPLGGALAGGAGRRAAGDVRDCAGGVSPRPAQAERGVSDEAAV